jgi:hypothetical protein
VAGGQPGDERGGGEDQDDRHEHRRHPVGQALHRGLAGLSPLDQPGDLGQRGAGADAGRLDDEATAGVDGGAGDPIAGPDLDRHALAGEQRAVDGGRPVDDDAVGRDLLAGPHDEPHPDRQLADRAAPLGAVGFEDGDVLGPHGGERLDRGAGPPLGPGLGVAPGEQEQGDAGGDLEVHLAADHEHHGRPAVGGEDAQRDERVHRGRPVPEVDERRPMERPRAPQGDRRGEEEGDQAVAGELESGDHAQRDHRHRQRDGPG